ncbi:hypothetical protein [Halosimplex salinum]|uniref:hypothetical protein n=1 Tax=Halosimplex salinum TaxID=1710538 RepID=UPI000F47B025|nr:hypothetical protein [Halosimplex salinum]
MDSPEADTGTDQFFDSRAGIAALGAAFLGVGIGLFYSLVTDSMAVFRVVLVAILVLVALSLYILYRREGLLTAENRLVGGFVLLAMALLFGLSELTSLPSEVVMGVVFLVGVIVPGLLLQYTEYGSPG